MSRFSLCLFVAGLQGGMCLCDKGGVVSIRVGHVLFSFPLSPFSVQLLSATSSMGD